MYPRPKRAGGTLIRAIKKQIEPVESFVKQAQFVNVACSGGPDSVALLHILAKYGRNVMSRDKLRVLHVNHHLRGEESNHDERFVKDLSKELNLPFFSEHVSCPLKGRSEEDSAREQRLAVFEKYPGIIFTAHQKDDVVETLLWRTFTGAPKVMTDFGGILLQYKNQIRPFLNCWRSDIMDYLQEEGLSSCVDATNFEGKLLRSKIRTKLVPVLNDVFPGWENKLLTARN